MMLYDIEEAISNDLSIQRVNKALVEIYGLPKGRPFTRTSYSAETGAGLTVLMCLTRLGSPADTVTIELSGPDLQSLPEGDKEISTQLRKLKTRRSHGETTHYVVEGIIRIKAMNPGPQIFGGAQEA